MIKLERFIKQKRKSMGMTQPELAERAGVGLRFIRELEQGKTTLRMDKVNQVLRLFGHELAASPMDRDSHAAMVNARSKDDDDARR
ncbi:MAG: helix-turn-helix transcriptional regulator [Ignavibacteriae bacterium]|nr:helix-turn-helix transcriptional regulator [Ignavibacteriota bacterium]